MAPLNYKRMLTAERFCLCQVSQQPPLKELIQHPFSFGGRGWGEKAALLGWTKCSSAQSAAHRSEMEIELACQLSANSAVLLLNAAAELSFTRGSTLHQLLIAPRRPVFPPRE